MIARSLVLVTFNTGEHMNKAVRMVFLSVVMGQSEVYALDPIHEYANYKNLDGVIAVLKYKPEAIDSRTKFKGRTALCIAGFNGYIEIVKELLKHGAKTEAWDNGGETPLMLIVDQYVYTPTSNLMEVVSEFLKSGADFNAKDSRGQSVLMRAAGRRDIVDLIKLHSIEKQIKAQLPEDIRILDGDHPGSYSKEFSDYGSKKK